ncbi:MAG TPA: hypothetical protein VFT39_03200 [Vicinamibacterales bacterium]|nr:hypothetical protein [Vicinamibacterales bacterium]
MLEAFKKSGKNGRNQAEELEALIATCREERAALSTMLTQMQLQSSKLATAGKSLQEVDEKAGQAHALLNEVMERLAKADTRAKELETIDARIGSLADSVREAREETGRLTAPGGELHQHRQAIETLSSQAQAALDASETLERDQATLDALRDQVRQSQSEVRDSKDEYAQLRAQLDTLRGHAAEISQEMTRTRDLSRSTLDEAQAAAQAVDSVENRLGPLQELREIARTTEERMTGLNALAEHVNQKIKALENQKHTVERAVVESNRLNEMIWAMDVQINKLNEGGLQVSRTEELIERVEGLAQQVSGQIEAGTRARDDFARDLLKLEKDRSALAGFAHAFTERMTVERTALDGFDQRVKGLQGAVADAEKKLEEHAEQDRRREAADARVAHLAKQLEKLNIEATELQRKQTTLESLQTSLVEVDDLAKRTASQYDSLDKGRQQLEGLRQEMRELFKSHAQAAELRDRLATDRTAVEAFLARIESFSAGIPQLEIRLDAIVEKLATVDDGTQKAAALAALAGDLDRRMSRLATQEQFVERVAGRLDALTTTTVEVDQKLEQQIMRRAELDALRSQADGVAIQVADARQKLEAVSAIQQQLLPLTTQLSALTEQIETAHARFLAAQKDEATLAEQERRLSTLDEQARLASSEIAARVSEVQALSSELHRSVSVKNELIDELAGVQARQNDVATQLDAVDGQLKRLEAAARDLDKRGSQLAFAEKRIGAFETQLVDLGEMANEIEGTLQRVTERETLVQTVRREVEGIHEISARSKADLEYVAAHRAEMVTLRDQLDGLLATIAETETRIAAIDGRRKVVDEVQVKTNVIVNMLEDVRLNMDTLGEHKTIMEQAMADFTRLTELVQESQTTLRALKAERELAGKIERGTKRLRAKTDRGQAGVKPGSNHTSDPGLTPV